MTLEFLLSHTNFKDHKLAKSRNLRSLWLREGL